MSSFQQLFEGKIDFEGQKKVEKIVHYSLTASTIISFLLGLALQSLQATFAFFGVSVVILLLAVVPPWSAYNSHPIKWLPNTETKKTQ